MDPVSTAAASTASQGSLSAVASSVAKVGLTSAAFAVTHPATIGFIAGLSTYYVVSKVFKKRIAMPLQPAVQPEMQAA